MPELYSCLNLSSAYAHIVSYSLFQDCDSVCRVNESLSSIYNMFISRIRIIDTFRQCGKI